MIVPFYYGHTRIENELPNGVEWELLENTFPKAEHEKKIIKSGIDELISQLKPRFRGTKILLVVPDHTRKCRLDVICPLLLGEFREHFNVEVEFLIANGSHVLQPEQTIRELVSPQIYDNYVVTQHDALSVHNDVYIGRTSMNTKIYLNRKVVEADYIVTIGGVLFHYFAGFGGGPKMLLPGVAGYETIRENHCRTIDPQTGRFHKECYEGNIRTNPVYLDLSEICRYIKNVLSFQVVLNDKGYVIQTGVGPILETHEKMSQIVRKLYGKRIGKKADVVVASAGGYPADVNMIQTHKSIHHAFQAVKEGGTIIVSAQCSEKIGSPTFLSYFDSPTSTEIAQRLTDDYKINGHTALCLKEKTERAKIILISDLDKTIVEKMGLIHAADFEAAWKLVTEQSFSFGYAMPQAHIMVPLSP